MWNERKCENRILWLIGNINPTYKQVKSLMFCIVSLFHIIAVLRNKLSNWDFLSYQNHTKGIWEDLSLLESDQRSTSRRWSSSFLEVHAYNVVSFAHTCPNDCTRCDIVIVLHIYKYSFKLVILHWLDECTLATNVLHFSGK